MNSHDRYCDCRRCKRGPKRWRRKAGRMIKHKQRRDAQHEARMQQLEAAGFQVVRL